MTPVTTSLAIVVSPRAMAEEATVVRRAAAAMVAEGASIVLFEPRPPLDPDRSESVPQRMERRFELPRRASYDPTVPFWLRRARREAMAEAGERISPDLVWGYGSDAWDVALALADEIDRPAVLAFRRESDLKGAPKALKNERAISLIAPCGALAERARSIVPEQFVRVVPIGVRLDDGNEETGPVASATQLAPVVTILTETGNSAAVRDALRACARAAERIPDLELLLECDGGVGKETWSMARTLALLPRTTAISRGELTRAAMDAATLLLCPEPAGGPRLETLLALGRGVPVIAAADPACDVLVDGETAIVVGSGGTAGAGDSRSVERLWADCVLAALLHPEELRPLVARARSAVRDLHRSSVAAETWLHTAGRLADGGPLRISPHLPHTSQLRG